MDDYQEKLRLAKEALDSGSYDRETIEYIFPELKLKESEDERIRNAIRYAIGQSTNSDGTLINGVSSEEAIKWLEKQGKQKPTSSKQCADYYNKDSELKMPRLTDFQNEIAQILFEREYDGSTETDADIARGRLEYEIAAIGLAPKLLDLAIKEKKPAWSEEDERIYSVVLELVISWSKGIIGGCIIPPNTDRYINWLKSIKQKMKGE